METTDNAPFVLAKESKSREAHPHHHGFVSFRLGGNRTSQLTWAGRRPSKREEKRWLVNGDAIITRHLPVAQSSTLRSVLTWQECFYPGCQLPLPCPLASTLGTSLQHLRLIRLQEHTVYISVYLCSYF
jgi:hypothetical protein